MADDVLFNWHYLYIKKQCKTVWLRSHHIKKHLSLIHVCKIGLTKENSVFSYTAKTQYRNSKQLFLEKKLCGLSPNFHIHMSVSDLYIPTIGLPILLAGKYVD